MQGKANRYHLSKALLALLLLFAPPVMADRIGQVRGFEYETSTVFIDGDRYVVARDAIVRRASSPDRAASLRDLRNGMPVQYETAANDAGEARITRLILLSDQ